MVFDGVAMGTLSVVGFGFVYQALPDRIKAFIVKHRLMTEVAVFYGTYVIHAGTATGLVAAAWAAVLCSVWLRIQRDPEQKATWDELTVVVGEALRVLARKAADGAKMLAEGIRGMLGETPAAAAVPAN